MLLIKQIHWQLSIEAFEENEYLLIKISDNGIGRKKAAVLAGKSVTKHKSMGLEITAHRISVMQNLNIKESPVVINDLVKDDGTAAGTEVMIRMPKIMVLQCLTK